MCTEDQHNEVVSILSRIEHQNKHQEPIHSIIAVSDYLSFTVDYRDRYYLLVWSTVAVTLDAGSRGLLNVPATSWFPIRFLPGTQIVTKGQGSNAVQLILLSTNDPINSSSITANAGTNLNTSLLALESGGNLAAIESVITKMIFDGNQYLKTTVLNGANQWNIAQNGAAYFTQATNNVSVPSGAANTVIKNNAGSIATLVVTATGSGTGNVQIFDSPTTNAGTVLFAFPATVNAGQSYQIYGWAKTGMTAQNVASGPVFTVFYS